MTEQIRNQIQNISKFEQKVIFTLLAVIVMLFSMYGYLLNSTVHSIVLRESAGKEKQTLISHIADLNAEYITSKNSITLDIASAHGFVSASEPQFISRQNTVKTLSFNNAI